MALTACGGGTNVVVPGPLSQGKPQAIWGQPQTGQAPRGLLILIPGGGWSGINKAALQGMVATSVVFTRVGYETMSVDYRAGAQGLEDVNRFYEQARKRVGSKLPICALGVSAGAQVAMMLAVRHPDLRCVIGLAGPTDLASLNKEGGSKAGYRLALQAFGQSGLAKQSPINYASTIKAKLLLAYAQNDPLVPPGQGRELATKLASAHVIVLPPGNAPFIHTGVGVPVSQSGVSATAKAALQVREAQFLAQEMSSAKR
jgi:acetyl esterase/lipase